MKIILLKDVKGVGRRYEEKNVSDGMAINLLIPKKLAVPATGSMANQIKSLKENEAKHKESEQKKIAEHVHTLSNTTITIKAKANEKQHLFAALTRDKISKLLQERGLNVPQECIEVEQGIKQLGTHQVPIRIGQKETHFTLIIEQN